MAMLILQINETFSHFNRTICPGMWRAYMKAKKHVSPLTAGNGVNITETSTLDMYVTEQQKLSAQYLADALARLPNMPQTSSKGKLGQFTEQYSEGVLSTWEYIELVMEAVDACLEVANKMLYANVSES